MLQPCTVTYFLQWRFLEQKGIALYTFRWLNKEEKTTCVISPSSRLAGSRRKDGYDHFDFKFFLTEELVWKAAGETSVFRV